MTSAIGLDTHTHTAAMQPLLQALLHGFDDGSRHIDALGGRSVRRNTSRERHPCPLTLRYEPQVSDMARGLAGPQAAAAPHRFDACSFIYQQPDWADELPHRLAAAEARALECS